MDPKTQRKQKIKSGTKSGSDSSCDHEHQEKKEVTKRKVAKGGTKSPGEPSSLPSPNTDSHSAQLHESERDVHQDHHADSVAVSSDLKSTISKRFVSSKAKKSRSAKLKTAYDIYKENLIVHGEYQGIASIAARHTALEQGAIQFDVGHVPREVGMNKKLVLITHFHTDHGSDVMNCVGYDERVTIFVPAYCAQDLFTKIKCDMSMQKGRPYDDKEIVGMVRVIGCKRENGEFKDQDKIESTQFSGLTIVELVKMGDQILVPLRGREEVMVEPFACYHTVDTCGYVVSEVRKRLADFITLSPGAEVDNNFTEDQPVRQRRKDKKSGDSTSDPTLVEHSVPLIDEEKDEVAEYRWNTDPKYKDVVEFQARTGTEIELEIVDKVVSPTYTLKVRRLRFPKGMNVPTKGETSECALSGHDFAFFKKYKIDVHADHLLPKTMFFGDTGSYVFNPKSVGYKRVSELLSTVETVIIESTFLEYRREMDDKKFKERAEKRHMFLFELAEQFKRYPQTKFLLIHFSACYDKETIKRYVDEYNSRFMNVSAFI